MSSWRREKGGQVRAIFYVEKKGVSLVLSIWMKEGGRLRRLVTGRS